MLAACLESGAGQAVYVRGEAGIGKTRLVEEFQRQAAARGLRLPHRAGARLRRRHRAGRDPRAGAQPARPARRRATRPPPGAAARAGRGRRPRRSPTAGSSSTTCSTCRSRPSCARSTTPWTARRAAAASARRWPRWCARPARARPLLLVVEDVHWADRPTLDHLASLADDGGRVPGAPGHDLAHRGRSARPRLARARRRQPARDHRSRPAAPAGGRARSPRPISRPTASFARRCVERAAGNPLFLEQLLRHAEESAEAGVPGSVQSLVQARMDRLDPPTSRRCRPPRCSASASRWTRCATCSSDPATAAPALVERLLVRPHGDGFLFAHALIRDAVYDSLLKTRRRELHRRAAALVRRRAIRCCTPSTSTGPRIRRRRAAYLAAARAQARGVPLRAGARRWSSAAWRLRRAPADRFALTCLQGELLHDLGRMADALSAYEAALEAAAGRCRALPGLARPRRGEADHRRPRRRVRRPGAGRGAGRPSSISPSELARHPFPARQPLLPARPASRAAWRSISAAWSSRAWPAPPSSRRRRSAASATPSTCAAA